MRFGTIAAVTAILLAGGAAPGREVSGMRAAPQDAPPEGCAAADSGADATLESRMLALSQEEAMEDPAAALAKGDAILAEPGAADVCPQAAVTALSYRGTARFFMHEYKGALDDFEAARERLVAAGLEDDPMMIQTLDNAASARSAMGDVEGALAVKEALLVRIAETEGAESSQYADTLYGTGLNYYRLGNTEEALTRIKRAVRIKRALPVVAGKADPNVAIFWMSEAAVLGQLGRNTEGLEAARGAALWAEENLGPDHLVTAATLHNFGGLLNKTGNFSEAIPVLRRTLAMRQRLTGENDSDVAMTINNLAFALEKSGERNEAEQLYVTAAEIFAAQDSDGAHEFAAIAMSNAANLAASYGRWDESLAHAETAMAEIAKGPDRDSSYYVRVALALAHARLQRGDYAGVGELLEPAVAAVAEKSEPHEEGLARARVVLGIATARGGDMAGGLAQAMPAYRAIRELLLGGSVYDSQKMRFEAGYSDTLTLFASLAFAAGDSETGFEALQLARLGDLERSGRALAARAVANSPRTAEMVRSLQDLVARERQIESRIAAAVGAADADARRAAEAELAQTREEAAALRAQVAAIFPSYRDLGRPQLTPYAELQRTLPAGSAVVIAQPTPEGVLSVAVTRETIAWHLSPRKANEFYDDVIAIRAAVEDAAQPFPVDAAHRLHTAIFGGDVGAAVEGKTHLDVLAGGYLSVLPFSLLVETAPEEGASLSDTAWLVRRFAISTPLNLSGITARQGATMRPIRFAGLGDPALAPIDRDAVQVAAVRGRDVTVQDLRALPSLPGAGEELAAISRTLENPDNLLVTGEAATEAFVRSADLTKYTVLAFATHGLVSGELGGLDEPALVFTPPAGMVQDEDGLLTASEIARLRLDADWVILSACNTASGSAAGTPTYSGLAQAFVFAGARSLLLSHWRVRDDAAAMLSVSTVRGAASGLGKAEALQAAQLQLMDDPDIPNAAHPAIWAPFILIES